MSKQSGNLLFLILLAVVLFAALSYAVTSSIRGDGKNSAKENNKLLVSQLLQNLTLMTNTITRWTMVNGWEISEIDMRGENFGGSIGNIPGCTTNNCNLFHPAGGGIEPNISIDYLQPTASSCSITGNEIVPSVFIAGVKGLGSDYGEVLIVYNCIDFEICDDINKALGIWNDGDAYINSASGTWNVDHLPFQSGVDFTGASYTTNQMSKNDSRLIGQTTFCARLPLSSQNARLFHVLYVQ